jgi:hypothetical protein
LQRSALALQLVATSAFALASAIAFASGTTATGGFATTGAGVILTLASAIALLWRQHQQQFFLFNRFSSNALALAAFSTSFVQVHQP